MAANSKGSYRSTRENSMTAFDKLPPAAREALAHAAFCYAPQPVLTHWRRGTHGFKTGKDIAQNVADWDRQHARKTAKKTWGVDYPCDIIGRIEARS